MNTNANTFFPKSIAIKNRDGREVDLVAWRRKDAPATPAAENNAAPIRQTHKKRVTVVRMETVEARERRLAEEKEKEEKMKEIFGKYLWSFNGLIYEYTPRVTCPARGGQATSP